MPPRSNHDGDDRAKRRERSRLRGLHGQVVDRLGQRIVSGEIAEGHVFDAADLEADLGVSRTVVREALRVLAAKGLVDPRQRRGTVVRPRGEWHLFDPDVLRWEFADSSTSLFESLAEVRRIVEPAIAALAARRRSPEDVARLGEALERMASAGTDPAGSTEADLAFHRTLAQCCHNELLPPIQEIILVGLRARDLVVHATRPGAEATRLHSDVLAAVREGDPDAAERAMRVLLEVATIDAQTAH
jgi:GntR family transcriptional regulator, galactonate operon transcriptional repressor